MPVSVFMSLAALLCMVFSAFSVVMAIRVGDVRKQRDVTFVGRWLFWYGVIMIVLVSLGGPLVMAVGLWSLVGGGK